jgi:DNA polymerase III subunit epsilon
VQFGVGTGTQRSFDDLGTPLADTTFCVLDLETTGGNREDDSITEIGVVKVRGGECLGTFQTLVNPGRAIPPRISVLTGLTDAVVAPAPRIEAVLPSLLEFLHGGVIVGHNVGFDLAFLRAALQRVGHAPLPPPRIDTAALARRLVRDEVPDCRLSTLASRLRLDHRPTHRALDDALATTDLLHLLIERASGLGVLGLDDLVTLGSIAGHPQAAKLKLTSNLPRAPGVYLFCGHRDEVIYVGKASNLRQRVRSYFGREDRRRIGPMLREAQSVRHHCLPDVLSAEVVEARLISRLLPRYNRAGTHAGRYCYVRLDVDAPWPRLAVVRDPAASGVHLGPLPSRTMALLVVDALQTALPLRRCSVRLGRRHQPAIDATPCIAAQLGVAACPCAGFADADAYSDAVRTAVEAMSGRPAAVVERLTDRMNVLAAAQRFEEAAMARDRISALEGGIRRTMQMNRLVDRGRFEVTDRDVTWIVDRARLVDVRVAGSTAGALPAPSPDPPAPGRPIPRLLADEALVLARHLERLEC